MEKPKRKKYSSKSIRPQNITDLDILWAIRDIPKQILNVQQKGILCMFVACIGNNEFCHYNKEQLENILGISERRARAHLDYLEDLNLLIITRPTRYFRGQSNQYKMNYSLIINTANKFRAQQEGGRNVRYSNKGDETSPLNGKEGGRNVREKGDVSSPQDIQVRNTRKTTDIQNEESLFF